MHKLQTQLSHSLRINLLVENNNQASIARIFLAMHMNSIMLIVCGFSTILIEYCENLTVSYILSVFSCRANGFPFYLGFILPFLAIYVFNWIMFIVILVSLVRHTTKVAKQRFIRRNVTIAAGLALVLGLGWGFGLAASSNKILMTSPVHSKSYLAFS